MGKNAVKDSARFDNGPLHRAFTVCMTTEKSRPPWAMADHNKKLIRYACQALSGCRPISPTIKAPRPIMTRDRQMRTHGFFCKTAVFLSFDGISLIFL